MQTSLIANKISIQSFAPEKLKSKSFSTKINYLSYALFAEYSTRDEEKNFCFFSPSIIPYLSQIYEVSRESLNQVFKKEFNLEELKEEKWHQQIKDWTQNILSRVKKMQNKTEKSIDFQFSPEHALGEWVYSLDKYKTQKGLFVDHQGNYCSIYKMFAESEEQYYEGDLCPGIRVLNLPFYNDLSMFIFLPTEDPKNSIKKLDQSMTKENLEFFFDNIRSIMGRAYSTLGIALPRFNLSKTENLLENLGNFPSVSNTTKINFDSSTSLNKCLNADKIIMQTNFRLEEGKEVSKKTVCEHYYGSFTPSVFNVDRPFAIIFFDHQTHTILGMSRITNLPHSTDSENESMQINLKIQSFQTLPEKEKNIAIRDLCRDLMYQGYIQKAQEIVELIGDKKGRENLYLDISLSWIKVGSLDNAIEFAHKISDTINKNLAFSLICKELIRLAQFDKALKAVSIISSEEIKDEFRLNIIKALMLNQETAKAIEVSKCFDRLYAEDKAVAHIAEVLVERGNIDQALEVAKNITLNSIKSEILLCISKAVLKEGLIDKALEIVELAETKNGKCLILREIAKAYMQNGDLIKASELAHLK